MTKEEITAVLNQLKNGEIEEIYVSKEEFLTYREVIVAREDFKHFRGIAQRGGNVVYRYMKEPRS